jgi:hypothetical protein
VIARLRSTARRLRSDQSGLALLEFAFLLPIFLVLSLTGAELANYIITRMRISQLALHVADNAARIGSGTMLEAKTINEGDINDMFTGAQLQSGELDLVKNGRVIVSSLEPVASPNTTGKYKIGWQRCKGDQTSFKSSYGVAGEASGLNMDGMGDAGRKVIAPDSGGTMFVEIRYKYQPLVKMSLAPDTEMKETASMMIRDRRDMSGVYPAAGVTASTC